MAVVSLGIEEVTLRAMLVQRRYGKGLQINSRN
jgi:hypothetical protein